MEITKKTTMGEMLEYDMGIAYILMQCGMHCVGCPSSIGESLEEACMVHGLNADEVMAAVAEIATKMVNKEELVDALTKAIINAQKHNDTQQ